MNLDAVQIYSVIVFSLLSGSVVSAAMEREDASVFKKIFLALFSIAIFIPTFGRVWGVW